MVFSNNDILRPLTDNEIIGMIKQLGKDLPRSIVGYNILKMHLRWKKMIENPKNGELVKRLDSDLVLKTVYTKRGGKLENCTFLSISGDKDLNILSFSYDPDELAECIRRTKLINWACGPLFLAIEDRHYSNIMKIIKEKQANIDLVLNCSANYLSMEKALKYKIEIPDNVHIDRIWEEDVPEISEYWHDKYPGSDKYTKCLVLLNDTRAIYSNETNEILSWILVDEQFTGAMLNTKPEHTRKGYAGTLVKLLARTLAKKYDLGSLSYIIKGNIKSEQCFKKLGYNRLQHDYHWIQIVRN